jgi:hypothetical protein
MFARVVLACFISMVTSMDRVTMGDVRVMGALFVMSTAVMLRRFAVMVRSVVVMFCCLSVVLGTLVRTRHANLRLIGHLRLAGATRPTGCRSQRHRARRAPRSREHGGVLSCMTCPAELTLLPGSAARYQQKC